MHKTSKIILIFSSILFLAILVSSAPTFAQDYNLSAITNSAFPDNWDTNRDLRKRNGKVLAWKHTKRGTYFEGKSCITLVVGSDSTGNTEYFVGEMYSNEKPFTKWHYGFIHYSDYFTDSATGMTFGFRDLHLERYSHRPAEEELYSLFQKWNYVFFEKNSKTIEAGLDEKLWREIFGFVPDRKKFIKPE